MKMKNYIKPKLSGRVRHCSNQTVILVSFGKGESLNPSLSIKQPPLMSKNWQHCNIKVNPFFPYRIMMVMMKLEKKFSHLERTNTWKEKVCLDAELPVLHSPFYIFSSKKLFFAIAYLSVNCENSSQSIPDRCFVRTVKNCVKCTLAFH